MTIDRAPLKRTQSQAKILVAEDHFDSRAAMSALLHALGYQVMEATNGREAVEMATADLPDLVLMDVMMPEMDGFDATRELRNRPHTMHLPIIAVTAMHEAREIALSVGMDDSVSKPVDTRLLVRKIEEWLTRKSA